jgi:hypothetical protein
MNAVLQAVLPQALPDQWRDALAFVLSGITWILDWQRYVLGLVLSGTNGIVVAKGVLLLLPTALLVAALWCSIVSVYTLPFRSGRGAFLGALLMAWWDAGRMTWFYWAGLVRFVVVLLGWVWGLLRLVGTIVARLIAFIFTRPFALLDWGTKQYFQPGVPWLAFLIILFWSALEATIFTFTLRPTLSEVLADLTGVELAGWAVTAVLWPFLFILISGSFAAIQALSEAVRAKKVSQIVGMVLVEAFVMFFEVMFLYRELIDAITPWIAEQTGFQLGFISTLALASFGWIGVRAMTWFLFGRYGTPALLGILARQDISGAKGSSVKTDVVGPEFWRGPISALKAESVWFKGEAREVFELLSLPVLQVLAAAVNFAVVVIMGRPTFTLPFRSLDQVLAGTPLFTASGKAPATGGVA